MTLYSNNKWLVPVKDVQCIAGGATRIWIRSSSDHDYGCKTKENSWPLMCLRAGKSLNRPLDGSEATKKKIAEAWEGPESILEHMWSQNSESYDLLSSNSMVYHACCNGGGLHLGNGLQKWSWQGPDTRIEILCEVK